MQDAPPRSGDHDRALAFEVSSGNLVTTSANHVENAFSAAVTREAQVGILTQGGSSFARARENSDAAYQGGVVRLIEVLDADANLMQVRDAKAQAHTEAARAAIASFRALGADGMRNAVSIRDATSRLARDHHDRFGESSSSPG
jgi:hypothetical protein